SDPTGGSGPASGVHTVQVEIQQDTGNYFDGTGFNDPSPHFLSANFDSGTGNWSFAFDHTKLPADGTYTVTAKATDWGGNVSSTISHTFTYDTVAPTISSLVMQDTNHNGKVDHVVATFSETLASSTDTSVWHLLNVPSGGSLASVSTSGS